MGENNYSWEAHTASLERTIRRLWIALIIALLIIAGLIIRDWQYETIVETQEVEQIADGEGDNQFIGGDYYGNAAESKDNG